MKNHKKCKKFQAWTDGSKSDNGTGFGIILKSKRASTSHKFKLNDCHSNNTAEIISILYTLKLIPNKSKIDIYTDSEISKSLLLNDDYRGPYLPVKQEFKYLCESKKLTVKLIKVKGHVDDGNIQVDALQKKEVLMEWLSNHIYYLHKIK